jgi:hypothetical protein
MNYEFFEKMTLSDYARVEWESIRSDLRGATGCDMTCLEFVNNVSYVLLSYKYIMPSEWDRSVQTPSDIMGVIFKLICYPNVADVSTHMSKIAALTSQLRSAINAEQRRCESSSKSD